MVIARINCLHNCRRSNSFRQVTEPFQVIRFKTAAQIYSPYEFHESMWVSGGRPPLILHSGLERGWWWASCAQLTEKFVSTSMSRNETETLLDMRNLKLRDFRLRRRSKTNTKIKYYTQNFSWRTWNRQWKWRKNTAGRRHRRRGSRAAPDKVPLCWILDFSWTHWYNVRLIINTQFQKNILDSKCCLNLRVFMQFQIVLFPCVTALLQQMYWNIVNL